METAENPDWSPAMDEEPLERRLGSAAAYATLNVPIASPEETADSVLRRMQGMRFESAGVVAVCSGQRLVGLVTIERLLGAPTRATLATVMDDQPPVVRPGVDQEHAAWLAAQRAEFCLAVVDEQERFRGLVPQQRLATILLEEHDEDLVRLGGFLKSSATARAASEESVTWRLWHRLPWLAVGLLVGLLLAAVMLPTISWLWHDVALAATVSLTVLAASTVATMIAMALPYLLHRLGYDPAFGSGPLATVVQDLLSIVIYLGAVRLVL